MRPFRSTMTDAWARDVAGDGAGAVHTVHRCRDLVERLAVSPDDAALADLGRRAALDGFALADVQGWVVALAARLPRRARRTILARDGAAAVAAGWAEGALERRASAPAGLAGLAALRRRLDEHYLRCHRLGLDPARDAVLVVLDADTAGLGPRAEAAAALALAAVARAAFPGSTVHAPHRARLVLLVPRHADVAGRVTRAVETARGVPGLAGRRVRGWVEPISPDHGLAAGHVEDLVRSG